MKLLISVVKLRLLSGRRVYLYLLGDRSSFICLHALICISFCFFVEDSRFVSNRRVLTTHFHCLLFCLLFFCVRYVAGTHTWPRSRTASAWTGRPMWTSARGRRRPTPPCPTSAAATTPAGMDSYLKLH